MANTPIAHTGLPTPRKNPPPLELGAPAQYLSRKFKSLEKLGQIQNLTITNDQHNTLKNNNKQDASMHLSLKKAKQLKEELELLNKENISFFWKNTFLCFISINALATAGHLVFSFKQIFPFEITGITVGVFFAINISMCWFLIANKSLNKSTRINRFPFLKRLTRHLDKIDSEYCELQNQQVLKGNQYMLFMLRAAREKISYMASLTDQTCQDFYKQHIEPGIQDLLLKSQTTLIDSLGEHIKQHFEQPWVKQLVEKNKTLKSLKAQPQKTFEPEQIRTLKKEIHNLVYNEYKGWFHTKEAAKKWSKRDQFRYKKRSLKKQYHRSWWPTITWGIAYCNSAVNGIIALTGALLAFNSIKPLSNFPTAGIIGMSIATLLLFIAGILFSYILTAKAYTLICKSFWIKSRSNQTIKTSKVKKTALFFALLTTLCSCFVAYFSGYHLLANMSQCFGNIQLLTNAPPALNILLGILGAFFTLNCALGLYASFALKNSQKIFDQGFAFFTKAYKNQSTSQKIWQGCKHVFAIIGSVGFTFSACYEIFSTFQGWQIPQVGIAVASVIAIPLLITISLIWISGVQAQNKPPQSNLNSPLTNNASIPLITQQLKTTISDQTLPRTLMGKMKNAEVLNFSTPDQYATQIVTNKKTTHVSQNAPTLPAKVRTKEKPPTHLTPTHLIESPTPSNKTKQEPGSRISLTSTSSNDFLDNRSAAPSPSRVCDMNRRPTQAAHNSDNHSLFPPISLVERRADPQITTDELSPILRFLREDTARIKSCSIP